MPRKEPARGKECGDENVRGRPPDEPPRATIKFPAEMGFAEKSRIAIQSGIHNARQISISWQAGADGILAPASDVPLRRDRTGTDFFEAAPPGFGNLQLEVALVFEDCVGEIARGQIRVPAPQRSPDEFVLAWTNWRYVRKTGTVHLDFADSVSVALIPLAYYKGVDSPVPVPRDDIEFKLITRKGEKPPVAFLDAALGSVKSVEPGQVLVKATFRGKSDYVCIDVTRSAAATSAHNNCNDFLPPGINLPSGMPQDAPRSLPQ